jgi:hypothetical protein
LLPKPVRLKSAFWSDSTPFALPSSGEESDRFWAEILNKTYVFDRKDREIHVLEKDVTKKSLADWLRRTRPFLDGGAANSDFRKLSVQVVGSGEKGQNAVGSSAAAPTATSAAIENSSLVEAMSKDAVMEVLHPDGERGLDSCVTERKDIVKEDQGNVNEAAAGASFGAAGNEPRKTDAQNSNLSEMDSSGMKEGSDDAKATGGCHD